MRVPKKTTLDKLNTTITLFSQVNAHRKGLTNWWEERNTYSISITARESFYLAVREWLMTLIPQVSQRSIGLVTIKNSGLTAIHDDDRVQNFHLKGHKIAVKVIKPPKTLSEFLHNDNSLDNDGGGGEEQVIFTCYSLDGQKVLMEELTALYKENSRKAHKAMIRTFGRWGDWTNYVELPKRDINSVALAEGQGERIIADMKDFLAAEDEYVRRGLPYHRGYLFYGEPGTGKSSYVKALAAHFDLDLWYLPLGSIANDHTLTSVVNSVRSRSILLLEDVDIFSGMKNREDDGKSFTMSGLLNTLDGVATPHGLITIMTTNDVDALDSAITRPGRADLKEYFGLLEKGQGERIYEAFYQRPPTQELPVAGRAPAALMNLFKSYMNDPEGAERACLAGEVGEWTEEDEAADSLRTKGAASYEKEPEDHSSLEDLIELSE